MKALGEMRHDDDERGEGGEAIRVPRAIAQNRHMVVMELVDGVPLRAVKEVGDPAGLYAELIENILRLARVGMIHGDFNEFNIMVKEEMDAEGGENQASSLPDESDRQQQQQQQLEDRKTVEDETDEDATTRIEPVIIDFPQMVSMDHANAEMYFDRDVKCIKDFFQRRFHFVSDEPGPFFRDARSQMMSPDRGWRLDVDVEASGFSKMMAKDLEKYMQEVGADDDLTHGDIASLSIGYDPEAAGSSGEQELDGSD